MRYLLLLLTTLMLSNTAQAQYEVNWGPEYKLEGSRLFSTFFLAGTTPSNYYFMMRPKRSGNLYVFDYNHRLLEVTEMDFSFQKDDFAPTKFIETKDGYYAFFTHESKQDNLLRMFVSKLEGPSSFGPLKEFSSREYDSKIGFLGFKRINAETSDVKTLETSQNKAFVLSAGPSRLKELRSEGSESISFEVFDSEFNLVWERVENFDGVSDKSLDVNEYIVDNSGVVYLGAKLWQDPSDKGSNFTNFDYLLMSVTESGFEQFPITLPDNSIPIDVGVFNGADDKIYLTGFYTDEASANYRANGVFYVRFNPQTKEIEKSQTHPFDKETLEGLVKDRAIEKDKGLYSSYTIRTFVMTENGDLSFIAEQFFITTHTTEDSGGRPSTYNKYHTRDILIPRFSEDGDLLHIAKIDKSFSSVTRQATSYVSASKGNRLYLLFNDGKSKEERAELDIEGGRKSRYTDLAVIGEDGKIEYLETLFSDKEIGGNFFPMLSTRTKSDALLLFCLNKKKYKFGTLQLK